MNKPPKNEIAWLGFIKAGSESFRKGRLNEAVQAFMQASEIMPERLEGWVNLGSALFEMKQYEAAAQTLQLAISLNPQFTISHMILGDALRLLGRPTESLESYTRAVSLQRTPLALNKLACALRARSRVEEAEELYLEAARIDPKFSLARVNRAVMQIECERYEEAHRQLMLVGKEVLTRTERQEVDAALSSISEHARLNEAIKAMVEHGDLSTLEARLTETPPELLQIDRMALRTVEDYAEFARNNRYSNVVATLPLPEDWPLIEAMHMIPLVHSVDEYLSVRNNPEATGKPAFELLQSLNMEPAIRAARKCADDMGDPVKAEVHLRHWHALACKEIPGFSPGHFKYTQNWAGRSPTLPRAQPNMCSGTIRYVISDICNGLPSGLPRAAVLFLGLLDPHPFSDGNGRIATIWLNRELEWAGLMPALFSNDLGYKGELGEAVAQVRNNGGTLTPLLEVITKAQQHARDFCIEIASLRDHSGTEP